MLRFIRRHCFGLLALFIALGGTAYAANTVRSQDIVDGQVKTVDLANGAVTLQKFGVVHNTATFDQLTSNCDTPGQWTACAPITVFVPAGQQYKFIVHSEIHGDAGGTNNVHAQFCAARGGPTCIHASPDFVTFYARGVTHGSDTAAYNLPSSSSNRSVQFSTAVNFQTALLADPNAHTYTTIEYWQA